jgi:hypothetical protein
MLVEFAMGLVLSRVDGQAFRLRLSVPCAVFSRTFGIVLASHPLANSTKIDDFPHPEALNETG